MKWLAILAFAMLTTAPAFGELRRMTVSFRYKGEPTKATFLSKVRTLDGEYDGQQFSRTANYLDKLRFDNYVLRSGKTVSEKEKFEWQTGFFGFEPLRMHDELLILHRGEPIEDSEFPLGLGQEILGTIAVDRLGSIFYEKLQGWDKSDFESLLLEKRLSPLGLRIPRPASLPWIGSTLPPGVSPHWDTTVGQEYFQPGNIVLGDVIQANALFAHENTWPLLHSLANAYGLFSTGRLIPPGIKKEVDGNTFVGPKVFVPTLVVWETFNPIEGKHIRTGSRTRYYQKAGAHPLWIGGVAEWLDPRIEDNAVQVLYKTGTEFREGWTELFAQHDDFSFVRDVKIESTRLESTADMDRLVSLTIPQGDRRIDHHPRSMDACLAHILAARSQSVQTLELNLGIGFSGIFGSAQMTNRIRVAAPGGDLRLAPKLRVSFD